MASGKAGPLVNKVEKKNEVDSQGEASAQPQVGAGKGGGKAGGKEKKTLEEEGAAEVPKGSSISGKKIKTEDASFSSTSSSSSSAQNSIAPVAAGKSLKRGSCAQEVVAPGASSSSSAIVQVEGEDLDLDDFFAPEKRVVIRDPVLKALTDRKRLCEIMSQTQLSF